MAVVTIIVLALTAVLTGMKTAYCIEWCTEREMPFYRVWTNRRLYPAVCIFLIIYLLCWYITNQSMPMVRLCDLVCSYILLAVVDIKRKVVPDPIMVCFVTGQLLMGVVALQPTELWHMIWTGSAFGLFILLFAFVSKGKFGMGDVLLLWGTAVTAGWAYTLMILTIGMFLSFVFGIGVIICKRGTLKTELPFVPFLAAGIIVHTMIFVM